MHFNKEFLFGVATSAAQVEGAALTDGRGLSIWDTFARVPNAIADNTLPEPSCDMYHSWKEDIALMKELNVQSYRFSFSWSRIFPEGVGQVNQKGVDYYKRMIDELHRQGIVPNATIYHWDIPYELQRRGGWLNRDIVDWYGEYASLLFREFGDSISALTAVLATLGPADEVCGFSQTNRPVRTHKNPDKDNCGQEYTIVNENIMSAAIRMKSGVLGTLMFNGDTVFPEKPFIMIMGTKGILYLPNPDHFGDDVILTEGMTSIAEFERGIREHALPVRHGYSENSRGIGAADMACAVREGRPHRASAEMAAHVLEILDGIVASSSSKRYVQLTSTFERPKPLTCEEIF